MFWIHENAIVVNLILSQVKQICIQFCNTVGQYNLRNLASPRWMSGEKVAVCSWKRPILHYHSYLLRNNSFFLSRNEYPQKKACDALRQVSFRCVSPFNNAHNSSARDSAQYPANCSFLWSIGFSVIFQANPTQLGAPHVSTSHRLSFGTRRTRKKVFFLCRRWYDDLAKKRKYQFAQKVEEPLRLNHSNMVPHACDVIIGQNLCVVDCVSNFEMIKVDAVSERGHGVWRE